MNQTMVPSDLNSFGEAFAMTPPARGFGLKLLGVAALGAAIVGLALPLWPTTPFAILAAWAFARSSPGFEDRLMRHPRLGPAIEAWRARGAIPGPAKAAATASLPVSWMGLWLADVGTGGLIAAGVTLGGVGLWILSRPT